MDYRERQLRKITTVRKRDQSSLDMCLFPDLEQDMQKISQGHPSYHSIKVSKNTGVVAKEFRGQHEEALLAKDGTT